MEECVLTPVLGSYEAHVLMRKWNCDMVQPFVSLLPTVLVNAIFLLRKVGLPTHEYGRRCPMGKFEVGRHTFTITRSLLLGGTQEMGLCGEEACENKKVWQPSSGVAGFVVVISGSAPRRFLSYRSTTRCTADLCPALPDTYGYFHVMILVP